MAGLFLLLFSFFDMVEDIKNIGSYDYTLLDALYIQILNAPAAIYRSLIVIILFAFIFALGTLSANSELIIVRSNGKSIFNIVLTSMTFCIIAMIVIAIFSEIYAVDLKNKGIQHKQMLLKEQTVGEQNLWFKEGQYVINIKNSYSDNSFANLKLFQINNNTLEKIITAKRAIIKDDTLVLNDVMERNFDINNFWTKHHETKIINISFTKNSVEMFKEDPKNISLFDIYKHISFLNQNNVEDKKFSVQFYERLIKVVILAITIIFASLFIFSSPRNPSLNKKFFMVAVVSLFFELMFRISSSLIVNFDYNYLYAVVLPIIAMLVIMFIVLLKKSNE